MIRKALVIVSQFLMLTALSQSLSFSFPDTIVYGPAIDSSALSCWTNDYVTNLTGQVITIDVVRVQNVTPPGWNSAFCFQVCSQPQIDSIRTTMGPNEAVNVAFHFIITSIPDSSTAVLKFKNVNNPSEVYYQRFYGISQSTAGISNLSPMLSPRLFPNPVTMGSELELSGSPYEIVDIEFFDLSGKLVKKELAVQGKILADFPEGLYIYKVFSGSGISGGKLVVVR